LIAKTQYQLTPADLQTVLALARAGTLAQAGERLRVDGSTVFRSLQRIERGLGQALFQRSRRVARVESHDNRWSTTWAHGSPKASVPSPRTTSSSSPPSPRPRRRPMRSRDF